MDKSKLLDCLYASLQRFNERIKTASGNELIFVSDAIDNTAILINDICKTIDQKKIDSEKQTIVFKMTEKELFLKTRESADLIARGFLLEGYSVGISKGSCNNDEGYFVHWRKV